MLLMETRMKHPPKNRPYRSSPAGVDEARGSGGLRRRRVSAGVLAAVAGVCLGVGAGAVPAAAVPAAGPAPAAAATKAAVPKGLESFYGQKVEWYDCVATAGVEKSDDKTGFQCAKVKVPLDYSQPGGQTIEIAMKKHLATGSVRQGTLFINPGGPGGSGVEAVSTMATSTFAGVQKAYDIIGFDPRGVGSSTAITCTSDTEVTAMAEAAPVTAGDGATAFEQRAAAISAQFKQFEASCAANTKPAELLDHVDTVSVARDLDVLRALSGDQKLNYTGFSYGTYLGAVYAENFPGNTERMVLDGAIDPALSLADQGLGQATGFEQALRTYVDYCQSSTGCPLSGGTDAGVQQIRDLITSANSTPLPTSDPGRTVAGSDIVAALSEYLYSSEQAWAPLTSALDQAINHRDGSLLAVQEDQAAASKDDGGGAFQAVTCLDYPVEGDKTTWAAQYEEAERVAPIFGDSSIGIDLACSAWGHNGTRKPAPIHARGAAPILVVGTTGDPATPYSWARSLADQLDSGRLLTWEGNGHTAYGGDAPCVNDAVNTYLLTGTMPDEGLTCHGDE